MGKSQGDCTASLLFSPSLSRLNLEVLLVSSEAKPWFSVIDKHVHTHPWSVCSQFRSSAFRHHPSRLCTCTRGSPHRPWEPALPRVSAGLCTPSCTGLPSRALRLALGATPGSLLRIHSSFHKPRNHRACRNQWSSNQQNEF